MAKKKIKIGKLTREQSNKICLAHNSRCSNCPLSMYISTDTYICIANIKILIKTLKKKSSEYEVEVEE